MKTKDRGRIDLNHRWPAIREAWLSCYHARSVRPGVSVSHGVGAEDEWCAEAYMETDYSKLSEADFDAAIRRYAVFRLIHPDEQESEDEP